MRWRAGARRAGAVFSGLTGLLFYGLWTFFAFGAVVYFANPDNRGYFLAALSSGLLFVTLYWQLAPVISAGFGASLELKKLLVYPIPHRKLFTIEVLLRLTTCPEMLIVVAGAVIGLLRNPAYGPEARVLAVLGALAFVVTNVLFSAGVRYLLERLFRRAHLKEVLLFLVAALGLLPQLLIFMNIRRGTLLHLVPAQLFWPWAAAAHIMLGEGTAPAGVWALVYLGFAWGFGRWQFERSIRYDAAGGRPEREAGRSGLADGVFRLPGRFLRDPLAAIVEKELRTLARIPRFRMVYAMSGVFGIVIYLPALRDPQPQSLMMQSALPVMALYGLLMLGPITWWNAFGFDRSAVQGYFSWPVRFRDAIVAKNITAALLVIPQILVVITLGRIAHLPASPGKCLETAAVVLTASLYWFSLGNICSVRIPRALDPDRMNQMANKMQALSIFSAPFLLLPIGLAYWARAVFESEIVFSGVLLIAAMVGGVFYKVGLDSAVSAGTHRREQILMQLSRADGPLSLT